MLKVTGITLVVVVAIITGIIFYVKNKLSNIKDEKNLAASIDRQANRFIDRGHAYGLVIGVFKQGKIYIKGYGTIENGQQAVPDSTTVFELASVSKLFTTSTLRLLTDSGQLALNDKLQDILTGKVNLPVSAQRTTLLHLATHMSGFPNLPDAFLSKMTDETNPYKDLRTADIYDYLKTCEGKKADGTFEYTNFGMGLLGHVLEIKTSEKYEQLVKNRLLAPLYMNNTFVTIDSMNRKKIIQGYDEDGKKTPVWTDTVLTGAGSFLSCASDMVRFIKANLDEDETGISKSLIATHARQLDGETGLGWMLPSAADRLLGNKDIVWHNGMAGGYASFLAIDKTNQYGLIILSNKAVDVTSFGMKLTMSVRTQSWE